MGRTRAFHPPPGQRPDLATAELEQSLRESGIELGFAEMKDPVKDKLKRFGLFERFGAESFHPTIGAAVDAYVEEHSVDWKP